MDTPRGAWRYAWWRGDYPTNDRFRDGVDSHRRPALLSRCEEDSRYLVERKRQGYLSYIISRCHSIWKTWIEYGEKVLKYSIIFRIPHIRAHSFVDMMGCRYISSVGVWPVSTFTYGYQLKIILSLRMTLSPSADFPRGGFIPCPTADYRLNLPRQSYNYVFELCSTNSVWLGFNH